MTYALFLLLFLAVPLFLLLFFLRRRLNPRHGLACALVCLLAFVYTAPWDNHAAKTKLWTFDPHFAPPRHFWLYLPWEEYAFYFAQGILMCLLVVALAQWLRPSEGKSAL